MTAWNAFEDSTRRIREAIKTGTMDLRPERHLTWTPLLLDRIGWRTARAGLDGLSRHLADELRGAERRLAESGETPLRATVVQAAFESPPGPNQARTQGGSRWRDPVGLAPSKGEAPPVSDKVQALLGPLRLSIVEHAIKRDVSPAAFAAEHGGDPLDVSRHFEALRKDGWLRLADPQNGAGPARPAERLYRIARPPIFDTDVWPELPGSIKAIVSSWVFDSYKRRVEEAREAGTLDAREDSCFSCEPVVLDRLGWERLVARADALFYFLVAIQAGVRARLADSADEAFVATVALMVFESPGESRRERPYLGHLA